MGRIQLETWRRLSHITGPGAVWMGLRFGVTPETGPKIVRVLREKGEDGSIKFDLERYVSEVLSGVEQANEKFGGELQVEAIQVTPDDYPTRGQAMWVAYLIARHAITGEDYDPA